MEAITLTDEQFDDIQSVDDLEMMDNVSRRARRKARKLRRKSKRKAKRKSKRTARRVKRLTKRGKTARAKRVAKRGAKRVKRVKKRLTKRAKRVETKGTAAERLAMAPLVPLKPTMVRTLRNKGVAVSRKDSIVKVANLFYNEVVRKSSKFEDEAEIDLFSYDEDNVAPVISGMVTAIIEFIKGAKKKKDTGSKLTKSEAIVVTGTEVVERKLQEKAKEEAAREVGEKILYDTGTQKNLILIGVAVLVVAVLLFRK